MLDCTFRNTLNLASLPYPHWCVCPSTVPSLLLPWMNYPCVMPSPPTCSRSHPSPFLCYSLVLLFCVTSFFFKKKNLLKLIYNVVLISSVQQNDSEWAEWLSGVYVCIYIHISSMGFPGGASGKEPACQYRRHKRSGFDPWVWKIPWRRARQPIPVFLPRESPWTEEPGGL